MLPDRARFEEISILAHGRLEEVPYSVLLAALERHERSGVLEIERKPLQKRIVFSRGVVVQCSSNLVHETLGRFLVDNGVVDEEAGHAALAESLSRRVPIGEILLEREMITPSALYRKLQQNLARKLLDPFTWADGTFHLTLEPTDERSTLKVKVPQLIFTGLIKLGSLVEAERGLAELRDKELVVDPGQRDRLARLRIPGRYGQVLEALTQPRALHELLVATSLSPAEVMRSIWALALLGFVAAADGVDLTTAETLPREKSEARRGTPRGRRAAKDRIMETYLSFQRRDAFELLGLEEEATLEEVEEAWLAFAEEMAPWALPEAGQASVAEKARIVFLAGSEAYAELRNTESRNTLIFRRKTLRESAAKPVTSEMRIETDLLDPKAQFARGQRQLSEGNIEKALELLQFASDCDPQNGLYRAEAAWCRYSLQPHRRADVLDELEAAVRLDPGRGEAWLYLGEVLTDAERFDEAKRALHQSNKLLAPDRRPIEALKRLKGSSGGSKKNRRG